jgi:hypothetical protein
VATFLLSGVGGVKVYSVRRAEPVTRKFRPRHEFDGAGGTLCTNFTVNVNVTSCACVGHVETVSGLCVRRLDLRSQTVSRCQSLFANNVIPWVD